ncbi:MAG: beta-N-acetylhexosaminidase [Bacteroidales bacterium]|nr:beta-N-acetylhexosaminidase [Bacteroidales bacterium]
MNLRTILSAIAIALTMASCSHKTSIEWIEGPLNPETGKAIHTLKIVNPPAEDGWSVWFCQFKRAMAIQDGSNGSAENITGSLYRSFPTAAYKDTVIIRYASTDLKRHSWAPEGFCLQTKDGKTLDLEVKYTLLPCDIIEDFPYTATALKPYDMIPELKSVKELEGKTSYSTPSTSIVAGDKAGWYRITIDGSIAIEATDEDGLYYAQTTLDNLKRNCGGKDLPNLVIEDWADMQFRGLMLDVSRNFTKKEGVLKPIDIMAHYKANVLHLHLGDDEGWRLEIDGLPELTSYGSYRNIPTIGANGEIIEENALLPSYSGGFTNKDATGNGYYTKADFIEILKYAKDHHIRVIPEFDTPGHSRAAVKSMEKRFKDTGDASYLLSEASDTSKYVSAQDYSDNAINVALPSTYKFISKVFDGIISIYKEAGIALETIHIGGDEVPSGAWKGSPSCQKLMQENGWTDINVLKDYYISHVLDIAQEKGVKIAGWQEVTSHLSDETFNRYLSQLEYTNLWNTLSAGHNDELPYKLANKGINVVLSNVTHTYADMAYNYGKTERGHSWGGYIDERRSYTLLPFDIYKSLRWDDYGKMLDISNAGDNKTSLNEGAEKHIIGVQVQLWTETIRNFGHVTYYFFPKMVGVLERGWNAYPSWASTNASDAPEFMQAFDKYYSIINDRESPYYDSIGISYTKRNYSLILL